MYSQTAAKGKRHAVKLTASHNIVAHISVFFVVKARSQNDAFMIGDGEDVMTELNRVIMQRKKKGWTRDKCLKADKNYALCNR